MGPGYGHRDEDDGEEGEERRKTKAPASEPSTSSPRSRSEPLIFDEHVYSGGYILTPARALSSSLTRCTGQVEAALSPQGLIDE